MGKLFLACVVVSASFAVTTADGRTLGLPTDKTEQFIQATWSRISALRARVELSYNSQADRHIDLLWDLAGDRVNAKLTRSSARSDIPPQTRVYVRNSKVSWYAFPNDSPKEPTAWYVEVCHPENGIIPRQINYGELGLYSIERLLKPITRQLKEQDLGDTNSASDSLVVKESEISGSKNRILREYTFVKDGVTNAKLFYVLDVSDGLKIIQSYNEISVNGSSVRTQQRDYGDFVLLDGVWFAKDISDYIWDRSGKLVVRTHLVFRSVQVNPELGSDDFSYSPPYGSHVIDKIHDMDYRAGYLNPDAPVGSDSKLAIAQPDSARDGAAASTQSADGPAAGLDDGASPGVSAISQETGGTPNLRGIVIVLASLLLIGMVLRYVLASRRERVQ